jgi:hypothetical protein
MNWLFVRLPILENATCSLSDGIRILMSKGFFSSSCTCRNDPINESDLLPCAPMSKHLNWNFSSGLSKR